MNAAELRAFVGVGAVERVDLIRWAAGGWGARVETLAGSRASWWMCTSRGALRRWKTLDAAVAFFERAGFKAVPVLVPSVELATAGEGAP